MADSAQRIRENAQNLFERLAAAHCLAPVQDGVVTLAVGGGRQTDDLVQWCIVGAPIDAKGGKALNRVDGVVEPFFRQHLAAEQAQQLVQLAAGEIHHDLSPAPTVGCEVDEISHGNLCFLD